MTDNLSTYSAEILRGSRSNALAVACKLQAINEQLGEVATLMRIDEVAPNLDMHRGAIGAVQSILESLNGAMEDRAEMMTTLLQAPYDA